MKKQILLLTFFFLNVNLFSQSCLNPGDDGILDYTTSYNCHQYVRAALLGTNQVYLTSGEPYSGASIGSFNSTKIKNSDDFIRVFNQSYAQAFSMENYDHSVLVLDGGFYTTTIGDFASTPGVGSYLYKHSHVAYSTGDCDYRMFATTKDYSITGSTYTVNEGATATFYLTDNSPNNLSSLLSSVTWSVNTSYLEIVSFNSSSITVRGKCGSGVSGAKTAYIHAELTNSGMTGSDYKPVIKRDITVNCVASCTGTLNGGYLYTFNTIQANTDYDVLMDEGSWTWVKTSGTTNYWYSSLSGKKLEFSVPSGCVTFNGYNSNCNITLTFCAYGGFYMQGLPNLNNTGPEAVNSIDYSIVSMSSGKVVRSGCVAAVDQAELIKGLDPGLYVLNINGDKKKILVKE